MGVKWRRQAQTPATRAGRRRVVAALYGALAATVVAMAIPNVPRSSAWWLPFAMVLLASILVTIGSAVVLYRTGQRLGDDEDAKLDERQRAVRDRAYLRAYRMVGTLLIVLVQYMVIAPGFGWPLPERVHWAILSWSVMLFTVTLPSAILAWTEPEVEVEDDEESRRVGGVVRMTDPLR
jgi:hypothetical protein